MFRKNYATLLFLLAAFLIFSSITACAQESVAAQISSITSGQLPKSANRLSPESVPAEFNQFFDGLLQAGDGKISGGAREVLAWTGDYKNKTKAENLVLQLEANFRQNGWQFKNEGTSGDIETFSLKKEGAPVRLVYGFFVSNEQVLVCALMEIVKSGSQISNVNPVNAQNSQTPTVKTDSSAKILNVEKRADYVNVMGSEMPALPQFPALAPKSGRVRGYVKDWTGKPLQGACIGVRGTYFAGAYSGAQGKTDANGYYEFAIPEGVSHYYNAGYQIEWGDGVAALGLHPADGNLDGFASTSGAVKNFVLLPYGLTSRENLQENPHLASTYYGGSIYIGYYAKEAGDNYATAGSITENSVIEITLTPEDASGKTFVIRKIAGFQSGFHINNIPVGRYNITAKVNGKPLKLKDYKKSNPLFGMTPSEATGAASILFEPNDAKASMSVPQFGGWKSVEIYVSMP